jgi:hypothetical protein
VGGSGRRNGRNSQGGDGGQRHQCFPHGFTFLMGAGTAIERSVTAKVPHFA